MINYYPKLWNKLLEYERLSPRGFSPNYKLVNIK